MGISQTTDITGKLNYGQLKPIAESEERNIVIAQIINRENLSLDSPGSKSSRNDNAIVLF